MCWLTMARKDDPVFNVRFVQFVENQPCLWNYTHPGYSKKEEVQRAWQQVANEIKDTVRNCRERWRTIRSSFLRSLKLARTQTGRGKRKYYLSKYLQFLVPYTKSRSCHKQLPPPPPTGTPTPGMVLRKPGHAAAFAQPSQREDEEAGKEIDCEMPLDVQVSEEEEDENNHARRNQVPQQHNQDRDQEQEQPTACLPLRLQAIKVEQPSSNAHQLQLERMVSHQHPSLVSVPAAALGNHLDWTDLTQWFKGNGSAHHLSHLNHKLATAPTPPTPPPPPPATPAPSALSGGLVAGPGGGISAPPDADYSFLISLHPYLKEMSGKQNRRFRQKVVGLIDDILDNKDV
ncbi:BAH and coiled-coil domain-containing protein 1 [Drosophila teissieri]|uniref:BAH and coiled-coil domain-containing protein 1 n=1 Tax=Drosophila teissieri TaxID=7243 RepID=UPI001CBA4794|nr:BAH and coiled-coil domain-containing protein 1 [Drosophila teissieri]